MEEEIEELGLPKSITSAGEESSSNRLHQLMQWNMMGKRRKAEDEKMFGPSPSDAVQRPSSTDAVEGSAPTDDEEKDGRKELSSLEEGKMAVVDVAAVENISSAAEEADGKMMENDTDTVDMDLEDKMSVEVSELSSSLPAQPAITSIVVAQLVLRSLRLHHQLATAIHLRVQNMIR